MRIVRRLAIAGLLLFAALLFGAPVLSGGVFLTLPGFASAAAYQVPAGYEPLHKGGIDPATGLYTRQNEDLVVAGSPPLILRRTYLSRYRVAKEFGIGTTHNGEEYLIGDGGKFQRASVVLAKGSQIRFRRTSSGSSFLNATFVHEESSTAWWGARLGWTGGRWAIRKLDGSVSIYQACGRGIANSCSILEWRDPAGLTIYYRRDRDGRLLKMDDGGDRWIAFEYDSANRVVRAHDSSMREATYTYDERGRVTTVVAPNGVSRYTYTDLDELETAREPKMSIENVYEHGRCVRQITRFPDDDRPLLFEFSYETSGQRIVKTTSKRSDGNWSEYTWNERRLAVAESHRYADSQPISLTYERDAVSGAVTSLTLTCPDRQGKPLRHSSLVRPGEEEAVKADLFSTRCSIKAHPLPTR